MAKRALTSAELREQAKRLIQKAANKDNRKYTDIGKMVAKRVGELTDPLKSDVDKILNS